MIIKAERFQSSDRDDRTASGIQCGQYHHCFYRTSCNALSVGTSRPSSVSENSYLLDAQSIVDIKENIIVYCIYSVYIAYTVYIVYCVYCIYCIYCVFNTQYIPYTIYTIHCIVYIVYCIVCIYSMYIACTVYIV